MFRRANRWPHRGQVHRGRGRVDKIVSRQPSARHVITSRPEPCAGQARRGAPVSAVRPAGRSPPGAGPDGVHRGGETAAGCRPAPACRRCLRHERWRPHPTKNAGRTVRGGAGPDGGGVATSALPPQDLGIAT
jgi:hypothetical protein